MTFLEFAQNASAGRGITHAFLTALRLVALLTCPVGVLLSAGAGPFTEAIFGRSGSP